MFPAFFPAVPEAVINAISATHNKTSGAANRNSSDSLAPAFFITELAGDVIFALKETMVTALNWAAYYGTKSSTANSADRAERRLNNPIYRLGFIIQSNRRSNSRDHERSGQKELT